MTKQIAVGSKNPVKVAAALAGFETTFADLEFSATGFAAQSKVSDQPMTCQETLAGAFNRTEHLKQLAPNADFWIGIEGGIETIEGQMFAGAWIVILDQAGNRGQGRSGSFQIPPAVQHLVESGMELGHANDAVFNKQNSKHAGGAVGSLTNNVISRQSLYEHAMALALIAFQNQELFSNGT